MSTHRAGITNAPSTAVSVRNFLVSTMLIAGLLSALPSPVAAGQPHYRADISDAEISFSVKVLGLVTVTGQFEQVEGGIRFTESCKTTGIMFRVRTDSVSTSNSMIDAVIRGPTLLDSARNPVITFSSSFVAAGPDGPGTITGELGLNGIQRSISFSVTPLDAADDMDARAQSYRAQTWIKRSDFGIPAPVPGTSNRILIQVTLTVREGELMLVRADTGDAAL